MECGKNNDAQPVQDSIRIMQELNDRIISYFFSESSPAISDERLQFIDDRGMAQALDWALDVSAYLATESLLRGDLHRAQKHARYYEAVKIRLRLHWRVREYLFERWAGIGRRS